MKSTKRDKDPKVKAILSSLRNPSTGHSTEIGDESSLRARNQQLELDIERRQEDYIDRERALKARIEDLEEDIDNQRQMKTGWMKTDSKMTKLKFVQGKILDNVNLVQERTSHILQEQERDLLRAFRARLFDVQTELEKEKSKKDDGAGAWIERSRQLESEVEWAKEVADRLERVNQALTQENTRLKTQFESQEEDRNFLIKQLVAVKKDNGRLRLEYTAVDNENKVLQDQKKSLEDSCKAMGNTSRLPGVPSASSNSLKDMNTGGKLSESEERYKEVNVRLRKLLTEERKSLAVVHKNYTLELRARTEMELLLRQCVEDVRKEVAKKHIETAHAGRPKSSGGVGAGTTGGTVGNMPVSDFHQEDRERVLELLLSQERVVTLLYAKTFPVNVKPANGQLPPEKDALAIGTSNDSNSRMPVDRPHSSGLGGGSGAAGSLSNINGSISEKVLPTIGQKSPNH